MRVLRLLIDDLAKRLLMILLAATVTAMSRLWLINIAGTAMQGRDAVGVSLYQLALMMASGGLFWFSSTMAFRFVATGLNRGVLGVTNRVYAQLASADLSKLERSCDTGVGACLSREANTIRRLHFPLTLAVFRLVFVICALGYIVLKAPIVGLIVLGILVVGTMLARGAQQRGGASLDESANHEYEAMGLLRQAIRGLASVKLHFGRRTDLLAALRSAIVRSARTRQQAAGIFHDQRFAFETWLFLPVGLVVYVAIEHLNLDQRVVLAVALALVFLLRSLVLTLEEMPKMLAAGQSFARLKELEALLIRCQPGLDRASQANENFPQGDFVSLELRNIVFRQPDSEGRPVDCVAIDDLVINRGEVIRLVGGNGVGKTTLLTLLAGFYRPSSGELILNGHEVSDRERIQYREWFAAVWENPWLFEREYDVKQGSEELIRSWLKRFELDGVTRFERGRFTRRNLSTGQRKRLALIGALMQRRPLLILDEWTAGQDPTYIQYFYKCVLPELKASGTTVIMADHDSEYLDVADRVLRMRNGRLVAA